MKLSRQQLRKIILLEMERQTADDVPSAQHQAAYFRRKAGIDPDARQTLRTFGDADASQEYELARSLGSQETRSQNVNELKIRKYAQQIEAYLPGFSKLPYPIMEVVVKYVFMSANPYMYTNVQMSDLEEQYDDEDAVEEMFMKLSDDPKSYDPSMFYIYAVGSSDDEFDKIDPHGTSDAQAGFHDGFMAAYQVVTTHPPFAEVYKGKVSYGAESQFIKMMRELRPEVKEHVLD